jgi:hypothetical protein
MVGEQAQEMQLAHWISTTQIGWLSNWVPPWVSMWFGVYPTYETMVAQLSGAALVVGSYYAARYTRHTLTSDSNGDVNNFQFSRVSSDTVIRSITADGTTNTCPQG